jgi:hypothetical protein
MENQITNDLSQSYTLDATGLLHDLFFIVLSLYADDKTDAQVSEVFGLSDKWAWKWRDRVIEHLGKYTLWGAVEEARSRKIFTDANRAPDADWRKMKFYYYAKKFYVKNGN